MAEAEVYLGLDLSTQVRALAFAVPEMHLVGRLSAGLIPLPHHPALLPLCLVPDYSSICAFLSLFAAQSVSSLAISSDGKVLHRETGPAALQPPQAFTVR